jgi:hypothetical protein
MTKPVAKAGANQMPNAMFDAVVEAISKEKNIPKRYLLPPEPKTDQEKADIIAFNNAIINSYSQHKKGANQMPNNTPTLRGQLAQEQAKAEKFLREHLAQSQSFAQALVNNLNDPVLCRLVERYIKANETLRNLPKDVA